MKILRVVSTIGQRNLICLYEVVEVALVVVGVPVVAFSGPVIGLITTVANKTASVVCFKIVPREDIFALDQAIEESSTFQDDSMVVKYNEKMEAEKKLQLFNFLHVHKTSEQILEKFLSRTPKL